MADGRYNDSSLLGCYVVASLGELLRTIVATRTGIREVLPSSYVREQATAGILMVMTQPSE